MSLTVFSDFLYVAVMDAGNNFRVTYSPNFICAFKGSTVLLHCNDNSLRTHADEPRGEEVMWDVRSSAVDLKKDLQYSGRVKYYNDDNLRRYSVEISDVRESDSAEYKCRIKRNPPDVESTGLPGVTLTVTGDAAFLLLTDKIQLNLTPHSDRHDIAASVSHVQIFR